MKIKTKTVSWDEVCSLPPIQHKPPKKPNFLFRSLIRLLSIPDLCNTSFQYTESRMEEAGKGPYLILMNHSSFIDLKISSKLFYPRPYCIVCTSDGFVGKEWLMRQIGCIPTQKFVPDITLIQDLLYTLKKKKTSVLMYPEASYSFDGCATPLPRKMGLLLKKLEVPVVTVITEGAFLRDPLYNGLQRRKVKVTAHLSCLLTKEEIQTKSVRELDALLDQAFTFDNFHTQYINRTAVTEAFRADGLNRILYRCPACETEGKMQGKGIHLTCEHCQKQYEMDIYGKLQAMDGKTEFPHIPDWYRWQRECVKKELENDTYRLDTEVEIGVLADYKNIYMVGRGRLVHDKNGFSLTGCDGKLHYTQTPRFSYSVYSDYFWYEIGDVICIGNKERLYYCFPKQRDVVTKIRFAAEEMYKRARSQREVQNV